MNLKIAFERLLNEYRAATETAEKNHPLAIFVRNDLPEIVLSKIQDQERYITKASTGQGVWAKIPWAAVFDRFVTETAQEKFYIVYLINEDCSGLYLSLNQGVTSIKRLHGDQMKATRHALEIQTKDFRSRLGHPISSLSYAPLDLKLSNRASNASLYEIGSVCAKFYKKGEIPDDIELESDLELFIRLYRILATKDLISTNNNQDVDEISLGEENLQTLREHKQIERNQSLAKEAKRKHGYICKACGFDFKKHYGDLGIEFIEAHHLQPLHTLKRQKVTLNPVKDFTVLCSNCHRMIHRSEYSNDIASFRLHHIKKTFFE